MDSDYSWQGKLACMVPREIPQDTWAGQLVQEVSMLRTVCAHVETYRLIHPP